MDKRHFTVVEHGGKEHGLYVSSTPSSAAKKAVSKLCVSNKSKKVEFYLREITQGSKKKTYGPYLGEMKKLKTPIELKGRVIQYKPFAKLSNKKINVKKEGMIGGGNAPSKSDSNPNSHKRNHVAEPPASIYNFVNSPRENPAARPAPINVSLSAAVERNNSPRGNPAAGPAPIYVSGSAAVERNNSEKLPKITDKLTVDEFNKIFCAMIDYLFEKKLIAMVPPIDDAQMWKWSGYVEPEIGYFCGVYPNGLKETMKTIIKENLKMDGNEIIMWDDKHFRKVDEAIKSMQIGELAQCNIQEERRKIMGIIHNIMCVISDIYKTTLDGPNNYRKLTNRRYRDNNDITIKLIEEYYYKLGDFSNSNFEN